MAYVAPFLSVMAVAIKKGGNKPYSKPVGFITASVIFAVSVKLTCAPLFLSQRTLLYARQHTSLPYLIF